MHMKAMKKTLNWEALQAPININKINVSNRSAIIRDDNGELLGLRSNRYRIFTNRDLVELVNRIAAKTGYELEGYQEFGKGKRIIAYLKLNEKCLPKGSRPLHICGNETSDYMLIGNAHDGSSSLFISFTNVLLRCENQFTTPFRVLNMRHLENIIFEESILDKIIRDYHSERDHLYQVMNKWTQRALSKGCIERLITHLFPGEKSQNNFHEIKRKRVEILVSINREIAELGFNFWGLFNGVTHYSTSRSSNSLFGNPYSEGNKLNKKAMAFLNKETTIA